LLRLLASPIAYDLRFAASARQAISPRIVRMLYYYQSIDEWQHSDGHSRSPGKDVQARSAHFVCVTTITLRANVVASFVVEL
jgi:hypothetical protein